jgi:hypothetical protein
MSEQEKKLWKESFDPTLVSLLQHYKQELALAIKTKDIERIKVVQSVIKAIVPNAFKR